MNTPPDSPHVVSILISPTAAGELNEVPEVHAVPGQGLEGDRYFLRVGTFFSGEHRPDAEITLAEAEQVEAFAREYEVEITPRDLRRNLVTRGIALNELVDREFTVGEVRLRGIRLCEPCEHLAKLTCRQVLHGLMHRAGLRAQILTDGVLRAGDAIKT